eukprot:6203426-Pleurochrysis_carterae.AAC.2
MTSGEDQRVSYILCRKLSRNRTAGSELWPPHFEVLLDPKIVMPKASDMSEGQQLARAIMVWSQFASALRMVRQFCCTKSHGFCNDGAAGGRYDVDTEDNLLVESALIHLSVQTFYSRRAFALPQYNSGQAVPRVNINKVKVEILLRLNTDVGIISANSHDVLEPVRPSQCCLQHCAAATSTSVIV